MQIISPLLDDFKFIRGRLGAGDQNGSIRLDVPAPISTAKEQLLPGRHFCLSTHGSKRIVELSNAEGQLESMPRKERRFGLSNARIVLLLKMRLCGPSILQIKLVNEQVNLIHTFTAGTTEKSRYLLMYPGPTHGVLQVYPICSATNYFRQNVLYLTLSVWHSFSSPQQEQVRQTVQSFRQVMH